MTWPVAGQTGDMPVRYHTSVWPSLPQSPTIPAMMDGNRSQGTKVALALEAFLGEASAVLAAARRRAGSWTE